MLIDNDNCRLCINDKKSIFYLLSINEKEVLRKNHSCIFIKKGEFIYKENEKPKGLICLTKGKVKVFKKGIGDRIQIVRMVKPIGMIGFRALFADQPYMASAMAIEDCTICVFDKTSLFKTLKMNGKLGLKFIQFFATELGFSNSQTITLTQKHIRGRLSESIIFLMETYGYEDDGETLKVYLSREDIANLSNMTTSNAIRTLALLAAEGAISYKGRKIRIVDLKKLEQISESG